MQLDARQKNIVKEMVDRDTLQEGYRDRALDLTTDVERTHYAGEIHDSIDYSNAEQDDEELLKALNSI